MLVAALLATAPAPASAAPGDLDERFSRDGLATYPGAFRDLAVAPDGSTLVAVDAQGQGGVVRFGTTGELNTAFGDAGGLVPALCCGGSTAALDLRESGRIVVGGRAAGSSSSADFAVIELGADGVSACGAGGLCTVADFAGGPDTLTDVFAEPSGKTLAAGIVTDGAVKKVGVARWLASGEPDATFSGDGKAMLDTGGVSTFAEKALVAGLPDGSVLLAGAGPGPDGTGSGDLLLAKLRPDGDLDPAFGGGDGWTTVDIAVRDDADSLALGDGGAIFVGIRPCAVGLHTDCSAAVAKFTPTGQLDPAFGAGGLIREAAGSQVAPAGDGSVFAAGTSPLRPYFLSDFNLALYTPAGVPEATFSGDGVATADFDLSQDFGGGLQITNTGSVVVGGLANSDAGLARFELLGGPADADADGVLDERDRCPERFAGAKHGCPEIERSLKLKALPGRRVTAKVRSPIDACEARRRIRVIRLVAGPDGVVARGRTSRGGAWRSTRELPEGRYRAVVKGGFRGAIGRCRNARSGVLRLG